SRSGSSTMQPATGQAAWQIEQANAPKQRSGSMTAIVFGAFFRGPDIILVHMHKIIPEPQGACAQGLAAVSLSLLERMTRGGSAHFGHDGEQRGVVLVDHV